MDEYMENVTDALEGEYGQDLADLLAFKGRHVKNVRKDVFKRQYWQKELNEQFSWAPDWINMLVAHIKCLTASNAEQRFDNEMKLCAEFIVVFSDKDKQSVGWANPLLGTILQDLRVLADEADQHQASKNKHKEEAGRIMMKLLAPACMDKDESANSRRWASLIVANNLFKLFTKLNLSMCDQTRRTIENNFNNEQINDFPEAHVTTFRYLVGYQYFFKGQYDDAQDNFKLAFSLCSRRFKKNIQLILLYLIPLNLLKGIAPTLDLLKVYNLPQYVEIVSALQAGDIRTLNESLKEHERFFEKRGLFLLMEKLKIIAYRNLFRKVFQLHVANSQQKGIPFSSRVKLESFRVALQFTHYDCSLEEVECIVAVLIYKGFIKGYISHSYKMLVVSKKAEVVTFPSLLSINPKVK
eukprot:CFRG6815T1